MATNLGKPLRLRNDGGAQLQLDRAGAVFSLELTTGNVLTFSGGLTTSGEIKNNNIIRTTGGADSQLPSSGGLEFVLGNLRFRSQGADPSTRGGFGFLGITSDGSASALYLEITTAGHTLPGSNNAYDLGATGTRFRDGWFARDVAVGRGVAFPATQSPSTDPNTLDDYEEGTWVATLTPATSGTITLKSAGKDGAYTKIGRMVTASAMLFVDSVASPVGTDVRISLPFTPANLPLYSGRGSFTVSFFDASTGTRTVLPAAFGEGSILGQVFLDASTIQANDELLFSITYFV